MIRETFNVISEEGLHARPASLLCQQASKFGGTAKIIYKEKEYTLKSIMIIMSLGIAQNDEFSISLDGDNESKHMESLRTVLTENEII